MTFDLGRVTTLSQTTLPKVGLIAVTFDLGRVTTILTGGYALLQIAVTFDLGRVTTDITYNKID